VSRSPEHSEGEAWQSHSHCSEIAGPVPSLGEEARSGFVSAAPRNGFSPLAVTAYFHDSLVNSRP